MSGLKRHGLPYKAAQGAPVAYVPLCPTCWLSVTFSVVPATREAFTLTPNGDPLSQRRHGWGYHMVGKIADENSGLVPLRTAAGSRGLEMSSAC
jgi:hypothetical protein